MRTSAVTYRSLRRFCSFGSGKKTQQTPPRAPARCALAFTLDVQLQGVRKDAGWRPGAREVEASRHSRLSCQTWTHRPISFAQRRRGLAFDVGGPLSLEAHDALAKMCIGRLSAVPLPVCRCVSVDQLRLPDMDVSKVRAGRTRGSIKVPCDFVLRRFSVSHSVQRLLALQQASDVCAASLRRCAKRGFQQSTELRVIPEKRENSGDQAKDVNTAQKQPLHFPNIIQGACASTCVLLNEL